VIYRAARQEDIPEVIDVVTRMVDGTMFKPPTPAKMAWVIKHWYNEGVWSHAGLIAFMVGMVSETFLNEERNAYEKALFVLPEHRGGSTAFRLVRNFEEWARGRGAVKIWLGQSVGQNQDSTLRFFERLGYQRQGFITCKTL